ncbi:hypothetical protein KP509_31G033100 [Ceratopteris richardii]|nr:hypothetical protein KP509_31G033100 [Ceratopteris richardii]
MFRKFRMHKSQKQSHQGNDTDSSTSSSSDSGSDSKSAETKHSNKMQYLQQRNEQLRLDLDRGLAQHQDLQSQIAALQEELKLLHQENSRLHESVATAHAETAALEAEIQGLNIELETNSSSALANVERLQHELDISEEEKRQTFIRLEENDSIIQGLRATIEDLEIRNSESNEKLLSSIELQKHHEEEITTLSDQKNEFQKEVSAQSTQLLDLNEEISQLKQSISLAESERDRSFESHQVLQQTITDLQNEVSSLKEDKGKLSDDLIIRTQHAQPLEQQLSELQEVVEGLRNEKMELDEAIKKSEINLVDLQNELVFVQSSLNKEISIQMKQKLAFKEQVDKLQAALETFQEERTREVELQDILEKHIADLNLNLREAQEALDSSENEKNKLVNEAEKNFKELQSEFALTQDRLNSELSVLIHERQVLSDQVLELNGVLETLHSEQEQGTEAQNVLEKHIADLELQLEQDKEALTSSEREKEEISALLKNMKNDLLDLQLKSTSVQEGLNAELLVQVHEKEALNVYIKELESALASINHEKSKSSEFQSILEARLTECEQQLEHIKAEKAEVSELLSTAEAKSLELKEEYYSMQSNLAAEISLLSEEKQSLGLQIEKLNAALAGLHSENSRAVELQDVFEMHITQLQHEVSQAKQEANNLSNDLRDKAANICQLEEEVKRKDENVNILQVNLLSKQEEMEALRSELEECSQHAQMFENEAHRLQASLQEMEYSMRSLEIRASNLEEDLELERMETKRLRTDLEDRVMSMERITGEFQGKDVLIADLREELSAKLEDQRILREEINDLMKEKGNLMEENTQTLEELERLKKDLQHALKTVYEKEAFIANLQMQLKVLADDSERNQGQYMQEYRSIMSEKGRVEAELSMLQEAKSTLEDELAKAIENAKETSDAENLALKAELNMSQAAISKLEDELAKALDYTKHMELDIKTYEEAMVASNEKIAELKSNLDLQLTRAQDAGEKCLLQEQMVSALQEENARLLAQIEILETSLKNFKEEINGYQVKIGNVHHERETSGAENLVLREDLAILQESRVKAEAAATKYEEEIAKLLEQTTCLQNELQELKYQNQSLSGKLELSIEKERINAMEMDSLLKDLQSSHEEFGSTHNADRSLHLGSNDTHEGHHSKLSHLKDRMLNILSDRSKTQEEAAAHAEHIKVLHLEIAKSEQALEASRGEQSSLFSKYEESISALKVLQSRIAQFEEQIVSLEEEKRRFHDLWLESVSESDKLSSNFLREKNELSEKLLVENEHLSKLQEDLRVEREAAVQNKRYIEDLQNQVQKLQLEIESVSISKDNQEKALKQELEEKNEKIQELFATSSTLTAEKSALNTQLDVQLEACCSIEANFCSLKDEHFSLAEKYKLLDEEAAASASLILKLEKDISQLISEKRVKEEETIQKDAYIQTLKDDLLAVQESETRTCKQLEEKVQKIIELEEELDGMKAAWLRFEEEHKQNAERLEIELKRLESVVIDLRDEKIALSERHTLITDKCNDLEVKCKGLQRQLVEEQEERNRVEGQLFLMDKLKMEAADEEEMARTMKESVASKQLEIDQVHSINGDLKEIMKKFENEVENLKDQIITLQKKNSLLIEDTSAKASLVEELDQKLTKFKETKISFEGGFALAVGNIGPVQAEVDKLLVKISKLNELSIATANDLQKLEDSMGKLQTNNLKLRDQLSSLAEKEKSYVIAVRFMRAEFFCLVQRVRVMKEEKEKLELAIEGERKKSGEVLSNVRQELLFLREENVRQRSIIFDRGEEKREAIRQLCCTLDYMQNKNRRLEATIKSIRDKIQRRIAASSTRRN